MGHPRPSTILIYNDFIAVVANNTGSLHIFDFDMLPKLIGIGWSEKEGYLQATINKKYTKAHHIVIGRPPQGMCVDHLNNKRWDNRKINLVFINYRYNTMKRIKKSTSKSPFKGITYHFGKWQACIETNNKNHYLGRFSNPVDAALAYDDAAKKMFGKYAITNKALGLL